MKQNGCGSEVFKHVPRLCCVTIASGNANVQPATPEADFDSQAAHLFYILNENCLSWRYLTLLWSSSSSSSSSSSQMDHSIHVHISAKALQLCSRLRDATFVALRLFEDQLVQCRIPHSTRGITAGRRAGGWSPSCDYSDHPVKCVGMIPEDIRTTYVYMSIYICIYTVLLYYCITALLHYCITVCVYVCMCVCVYVCMCVCVWTWGSPKYYHHHHHRHSHSHRHRHHQQQQIFFFQTWNMMINNWIFWDSIFKQTVPVWPYVCGVCIYAYCRYHRYQDMQASNICTFYCLIISHLTLQLLGRNN